MAIENNIRVELEDLQAVGLESLPLQQGGYIAQPSVFHELHCLVRFNTSLGSIFGKSDHVDISRKKSDTGSSKTTTSIPQIQVKPN